MKTRILIVDDEPEVLEFLGKRLASRGYEVFTASDGDKGLRVAEENKPDLIVLDVMMPVKDGFSMLKDLQAREDLRKIPVIMATAKGRSEDIYYGQDLGATDYLVKPVNFENLLKYIRKYTFAEECDFNQGG